MSIGRISGYVPPDATEAGIMPMDASGTNRGRFWILDNTGYSGMVGFGISQKLFDAGWQ